MECARSGATRRPPPDLVYTLLDKTSARMGTPAFDALAVDERKQIVKRLYDYEHGMCFIDEEPFDLAQPVDVDHIKARDRGGEDSLNKWRSAWH
jgi:hypothetical protein